MAWFNILLGRQHFVLSIFLYLIILCKISSSTRLLSRRNLEIEIENNTVNNDLKYLVFGTSVSWGARVEHRFIEAYPYILSPNVTNLSMRASDPSYPSMCTQSMVKDSIYDVIIIEYDRTYRQGLYELTHRLRRRFPDAVIILIKTWSLMNINVKEKGNKNIQRLRSWLIKYGFQKNRQDSQEFIANSDDEEVEFIFDGIGKSRDSYMDQVSKETGALIYSWNMNGKLKDLIYRRMPLFQDFVHWNKIGHGIVAHDIKQLLTQNIEKVKHCSAGDNTPNGCSIGDWGDGDVCSNWIESSVLSPLIQIEDSKIDQFDLAGMKYAIQFPQKVTKFVIKSPFMDRKYLSLTFMATEKSSNHIYPNVEVSILGNDGHIEAKAILEPLVQYGYPVHVQRTMKIGLLNPGRNLIELRVLDNSEQPFRLVGFSITNGEMKASRIFELVDV